MNLSSEAKKLLMTAKKPGGGVVADDADLKMATVLGDYNQMDQVDVGFMGIPFDTSSAGRPGSKYGPDSIRDVMYGLTTYEAGLDVDISGLKMADFGNVYVKQTDVLETHRRVETALTEVISKGVIPLVFGGDHGLSYPTVKSLMNNTKGKVGVINFDAHLDIRKIHDGFITSGTPFRRLMNEPERNPMDPKNFVEVGINGFCAAQEYGKFCKEQGIKIFSARDIHRAGIEEVIAQAIEIAADGTDAIWLSFDIDGIDLSSVVGTCSPHPGGMTAAQALEAVWMIAQHPKCLGMDIMEVAPPLDFDNITSLTAAYLGMQFLAGIAKRRQA